jgi:protein-S-isoprenylcysteine O-methyltransferase Ste14
MPDAKSHDATPSQRDGTSKGDATGAADAGNEAGAVLERPSSFPWPPVLLTAVFATGWYLGRAHPLPWPGAGDTPARVIGWGFLIGGIALAVWAIATMMRAGAQVRPDRGATALVTHGPFRRFRNPIYLADTMLLLGLAEITQNVWIAILTPVFVIAVTWLAILPEERHLEAKYGEDYLDYKAKSRRWL